jgi:hypothetical protein
MVRWSIQLKFVSDLLHSNFMNFNDFYSFHIFGFYTVILELSLCYAFAHLREFVVHKGLLRVKSTFNNDSVSFKCVCGFQGVLHVRSKVSALPQVSLAWLPTVIFDFKGSIKSCSMVEVSSIMTVLRSMVWILFSTNFTIVKFVIFSARWDFTSVVV